MFVCLSRRLPPLQRYCTVEPPTQIVGHHDAPATDPAPARLQVLQKGTLQACASLSGHVALSAVVARRFDCTLQSHLRNPQWLGMFGVSKSGGTMSAHYEYIDGGCAARFTPPICPGPGRSCCSNNFPYCGVPGSVSFGSQLLPPHVAAALAVGCSATGPPSALMAVHGWRWVSPVWYNLIFGFGAVICLNHSTADAGTNSSFELSFDRGGHQSSHQPRIVPSGNGGP